MLVNHGSAICKILVGVSGNQSLWNIFVEIFHRISWIFLHDILAEKQIWSLQALFEALDDFFYSLPKSTNMPYRPPHFTFHSSLPFFLPKFSYHDGNRTHVVHSRHYIRKLLSFEVFILVFSFYTFLILWICCVVVYSMIFFI